MKLLAVAEYRRPNIKRGALSDISTHKGKPLDLCVVFTADPAPQIAWLKDGKVTQGDDHVKITIDKKDFEHGLIEYTCTLHIDASRFHFKLCSLRSCLIDSFLLSEKHSQT